MKKILVAMISVLTAVFVMADGQTKGASAAAAASRVTFAPRADKQAVVSAIYSSGSSTLGEVKFWDRTGTDYAITLAAAISATNINIANASSTITNGEYVVVSYADGGAPLYSLVGVHTTTNISLVTPLAKAVTTADRVYEVSAKASIINGATAFNPVKGPVYIAPKNSPLVVENTGTTNSSLLVTVEWE